MWEFDKTGNAPSSSGPHAGAVPPHAPSPPPAESGTRVSARARLGLDGDSVTDQDDTRCGPLARDGIGRCGCQPLQRSKDPRVRSSSRRQLLHALEQHCKGLTGWS
jgi:hypothetical protein